ncbi:MAG: diaminopimelate epimerase [Desulfobacterales bacterium]|nr:diaminopimelate epimerase [Desulfobacterales bacterium]
MDPIPFWKMSGSGNDFIVIDNRGGRIGLATLAGFTSRICRRKLSVGADGLILVENAADADFSWQFFNSDGSRAEMCGNGARCAARYAYLNGIAPESLAFNTDVGQIQARIIGDRVRIQMTDPVDCRPERTIDLGRGVVKAASINTGVPHVVVFVDDIDAVDVVALGREIRFHQDFAPAGTNANFIAPQPDGTVAIRTYERGVEDETLACGTGAVAAALILARTAARPSPVRLLTRSGGELSVGFEMDQGHFQEVFLEGDARVIYRGTMDAEAWHYSQPQDAIGP